MSRTEEKESGLQADADQVANKMECARIAVDPRATGAALVEWFADSAFGPISVEEIFIVLNDRIREVRSNKLGSIEDLLVMQATGLNAIFVELARRSHANLGKYLTTVESYMRLALKAQAQCRATLETLAAIKNPPVVYAQQANIAGGHQQVNNGCIRAPGGGDSGNLPNELLEAPNEAAERLDIGAKDATGRSDQKLESLEPIHRPTHTSGESSLKSQRIQGRQANESAGGTRHVPINDTRASDGGAGSLVKKEIPVI